MKQRIKNFYRFVTDNFWFLFFIIIMIVLCIYVWINGYYRLKGNNTDTYKSIATEFAKNGDDYITLPDGIEAKIIISGNTMFGYSDILTAELHDGELFFNYERSLLSDVPLIVICLFVSFFITLIFYTIKHFIFYLIRYFIIKK